MKILRISKKRQMIKVKVDSEDDLWYLKGFIEPGDLVKARTPRSLFLEREGKKIKVDKKPMFLKIEIEKVEFHEHIFRLRLTGKIIEGPENVQLGDYHTIEVRLGSRLTIIKQKWKDYQINKLKKAETKVPNILIVVMDLDQATFGLLRKNKVEIISEIKNPYSLQQEEEKIVEYYRKIANELEKISSKMKNIIIAGPGFTKEHVSKIIREKHPETYKKIVIGLASSSTIAGINEIIKSGMLEKLVKESEIIKETKLVDEFFLHIRKQDGLAVYGLDAVKQAENIGAVQFLLVSDEQIRNKEIEELAKRVEEKNGIVQIISDIHDLGEQFKRMGGIGAILRFRIF